MAFKPVKISARGLRELIENDARSGAMVAREIGVEPRSLANWVSGDRDVVGMRPEAYFGLIRLFGERVERLRVPNGGPVDFHLSKENKRLIIDSAALLKKPIDELIRIAIVEYVERETKPEVFEAPDGRTLVARSAEAPSAPPPARQHAPRGPHRSRK